LVEYVIEFDISPLAAFHRTNVLPDTQQKCNTGFIIQMQNF